MLSNFPNWGSGVTFPVVPISCFTGEYYCCSGHFLNARFLAKNWDPGESILLRLHVSVLQVALKMALELGNHFSNWPFQAWMMCTSILAFSVTVAGPRLWVSAVWAPEHFVSDNQEKPQFPLAAELVGRHFIHGFLILIFSVTYQLSFLTIFLTDNRV